MSDEDLLSPFEFTVNSIGSLLIYPQEDLTVMAAKVVSIQVDHLQISVRTPSPLSVTLTNEGPTFASSAFRPSSPSPAARFCPLWAIAAFVQIPPL